MKLPRIIILFFILISGFMASCSPEDAHTTLANQKISGDVINGYRIIPIPNTEKNMQLNVYRGDYIKFKLDESFEDTILSIPDLTINEKVSNNFKDAPFFKMKKAGTFTFTLGEVKGVIAVHDYQQSNYKEVTSQEAAEFLKSDRPLILDVRTPGEYDRGHLKDAVLIPVQVLHNHLSRLSDFKDKDILVYCATGNRSTVASKMLIDNGFTRITNMRHGIVDWSAKKYPVTR